MSDTALDLGDIQDVQAAISGPISRTPLVLAPPLSAMAAHDILPKLATRQPTGAFKQRGAMPVELGEVIIGAGHGRTSEADITICNLIGTGAQDAAIATYSLAAARKAGGGTIIHA